MTTNKSCVASLFVIVIFTSLELLQAQTVEGKGRGTLPRFEDYPVIETWQGPAASVKITSSSERLFRNQLTEAGKESPNFAGHYRFTDWGCGTRCSAGAVLNLKTGRISAPPLAKKASGWEHWIFCAALYDKCGIEYRVDSRLMIIRCGSSANEEAENTPDVYYFLWEHDRFRQLLHKPGKGKFSLGLLQSSNALS